MGNGSCVLCGNKSRCFKQLNRLELEFASSNKAQVRFKKGEIIVKQGSFSTHILFIKSGLAKVYKEINSKTNMILNIFPSGNYIGLPSLFEEGTMKYTVAAIEDTVICAIDIKIFEKLILSNGAFAKEVINTINNCTNFNYEKLISLTQKQMNGRLADALLFLSNEIYKSTAFKLSLTRKDLAEFTGMSTMSVVKTIQEFKNDGVITDEKGLITIPDIAALKRISEVG